MVTSKLRMIFSRLPADVKATGFSRYVVYFRKKRFLGKRAAIHSRCLVHLERKGKGRQRDCA